MNTLIITGGNIDKDFAISICNKEKFDIIIGVDNGLAFLRNVNIMTTHICVFFVTVKL